MSLAELPSSINHDPDCALGLLMTEANDFQAQQLEATSVKTYVQRVQAQPDSGPIPNEAFVNEKIWTRHIAALACARTIVAGECPLFRINGQGEIARRSHLQIVR